MTKATIHDRIKTLVPVDADFSQRSIPAGTVGTVVERYRDPEGYAVDPALPDGGDIGEMAYENLILAPEQFVALRKLQQDPETPRPGGASTINEKLAWAARDPGYGGSYPKPSPHCPAVHVDLARCACAIPDSPYAPSTCP